MNTLDKLTIKEILSSTRITHDGERIDEDDLFELANRNASILDSLSYKLERDYDGEIHLSVW